MKWLRVDTEALPTSASAHVGVVRKAETKSELLDSIGRALAFPAWGFNWDALEEMLRDLTWLSGDIIVLIHDELPRDDQERHTYRAILDDVIAFRNALLMPSLVILVPDDPPS